MIYIWIAIVLSLMLLSFFVGRILEKKARTLHGDLYLDSGDMYLALDCKYEEVACSSYILLQVRNKTRK